MSKLSPGPWKWLIGVGAALEGASGLQGRTKRLLEVKPGAIFNASQADLDAIAKGPEMVAMLRKLEWQHNGERYCPECEGCEPVHRDACTLAALLKDLPES